MYNLPMTLEISQTIFFILIAFYVILVLHLLTVIILEIFTKKIKNRHLILSNLIPAIYIIYKLVWGYLYGSYEFLLGLTIFIAAYFALKEAFEYYKPQK